MLRALLALALATSLVPHAAAFASLPPGTSPHDDVTAAAKEAGFPPDAVEALQQAVREPDFQESEYDPQLDEPTRTDADKEYKPFHHCDRIVPGNDTQAFADTVAYIDEQREAALAASAAGQSKDAIAALGRALHALQDCYSHSNIVDLDAQAQAAHQEALLHVGEAVAGLRIVSYDPGADEPGRPDGDDYAHDDFAKDSSGMNDEAKAELPDGRTKYQAAVDLAQDATVAFLQDFLGRIPEAEKAELMDAKAQDGGAPNDLPVPGLPLAAVLVAIGFGALPWRRR